MINGKELLNLIEVTKKNYKDYCVEQRKGVEDCSSCKYNNSKDCYESYILDSPNKDILSKYMCIKSNNNKPKKSQTEFIEKDGIKYCKSNKRMMYDEEFHDRHGEKWTDEELGYLCFMRPAMKYADISMALGRTPGVCADKYHHLKKKNKIDYYKEKYNNM